MENGIYRHWHLFHTLQLTLFSIELNFLVRSGHTSQYIDNRRDIDGQTFLLTEALLARMETYKFTAVSGVTSK